MSSIPEDFLFTKEHEWVQFEDGIATVGISHFAQEALGDITFVQLPSEGEEFKKDDSFGVVESVKAVSDLYAPLSGRVVEINQPLLSAPELINDDPYQDGWMIKLEVEEDASEKEELMDATAYKEYVEDQA